MCPADGSPLGGDSEPQAEPPPKAPDPLIGTLLLGRFKVVRPLGDGGMGVVYEAEDALIGRRVAIKILNPRYAERPEVAARLINEARLASSVHHPHVVDVFDVGTSDGRAFIVMELCEGQSLAQILHEEGGLPEARVIEIGRQVADALGAAHERGVIHRDVKPENVLCAERAGADFVKVVDFGISKAVRGAELTPRLTQDGQLLGTPLYMSPEQARGDEDLDHRIDIYALGVILYESLTGETPFRGPNYLGIIQQVLRDRPTPPRALRPELRIGEAIERVVLHAMAFSREDRYPSMAALAADLVRARDGDEVAEGPRPVALGPAAEPSPRRGPGIARPLAAALGVAALGALAIGWRVARTAPTLDSPTASAATQAAPPPPPPLPTAAAPSAPARALLRLSSRPPGAEVLSPDGERLGFAGGGPNGPSEIALDPAPQDLRFRLHGYKVQVRHVEPQGPERQIVVELAPEERRPARPFPHKGAGRPGPVEKTAGAPPVEQPPVVVFPGAAERR